KDFPENWLPLLAPPLPRGQGPGPGMGPGPGGQAPLQPPRGAVAFDAEQRILFALSRTTDNARHGLVAFPIDAGDAQLIEFPANVFAAACSQQIRFFQLELSKRLVVFASAVHDAQLRNPCPSHGFIQFDLVSRQVSFTGVQGEGQFNAAPGASAEINDFVYGANTSAPPQPRADVLHVFDGVSASAFRMNLPPEVGSFQNLQPVPQLSSLIGLATNTIPGDAGFVIFDLDRNQTRILPLPDGFASMTQAGVFLATRKLVARGFKPGNLGSQLLIYDLVTGDLAILPNPPNIEFFGPPPQAQQPQPGQPPQPPAQLLISNTKSNTVAAVAYDGARRQAGVIVVRIP
ncbi:MAG: hypothetical protein ACRD96_06870, partial [Bryobacteraceae bacterium]